MKQPGRNGLEQMLTPGLKGCVRLTSQAPASAMTTHSSYTEERQEIFASSPKEASKCHLSCTCSNFYF